MKKLLYFLENKVAPKINKANSNIWIVTMKDSIMQILPLILLGSVFIMLTIPGSHFSISWWPDFWTPFGWTMGMVSLVLSFLIPFNFMEKKRKRKQRITSAFTGLILFLIIITPQVITDGTIGFLWVAPLGAGGMFVAILSGIFVSSVMLLFSNISFFKEDSVVPDFVRGWFDSMLPIGLIIVIGWLVVDVWSVDVYTIILAIFEPLKQVVETPWGFTLLVFSWTFLYSMGISSWVMTPITKPIFLAGITANIAMANSGALDPANLNLAISEVNTAYMAVGGVGFTLPLVVMLAFSKSKKLKALGRASFVPSLFNINEPVVFGCIAWNPILMIPMNLTGIILPLAVWFGTKMILFAPIPTVLFEMWYVPYPFLTWLITGSVKAVIFLFILIALVTLIYYPFFKIYEKQEVLAEQKQLENESKSA